MKQPSLRVTKWLGYNIPVEGVCTACPNVTFKAKAVGHRPDREEYKRSLQSLFDAHLKQSHMPVEGHDVKD